MAIFGGALCSRFALVRPLLFSFIGFLPPPFFLVPNACCVSCVLVPSSLLTIVFHISFSLGLGSTFVPHVKAAKSDKTDEKAKGKITGKSKKPRVGDVEMVEEDAEKEEDSDSDAEESRFVAVGKKNQKRKHFTEVLEETAPKKNKRKTKKVKGEATAPESKEKTKQSKDIVKKSNTEVLKTESKSEADMPVEDTNEANGTNGTEYAEMKEEGEKKEGEGEGDVPGKKWKVCLCFNFFKNLYHVLKSHVCSLPSFRSPLVPCDGSPPPLLPFCLTPTTVLNTQRKRKKVRSKRKNIKKDTRGPDYQPGGKFYKGKVDLRTRGPNSW